MSCTSLPSILGLIPHECVPFLPFCWLGMRWTTLHLSDCPQNSKLLQRCNLSLCLSLSLSHTHTHTHTNTHTHCLTVCVSHLSFTHTQTHTLSHKHTLSDSAGTTNACSTNNGGCPHLCLPKPGSQKVCACTTGFVPSQNGSHCEQYDSFAIVSTPRLIRGFHINSSDHSEAMVPVSGSTYAFTFSQFHVFTAGIFGHY